MQSGKNYHYLQPLMDEILDVRYTDLDKLLICCQELLHISENEGYEYGLAFALTYIGDYHIARNNGQAAGPYLEKAQKLCHEKKYDELLMNVYIFYGIYYDMLLDLLTSLNCTLEALELATKLNDSLKKSIIVNNIANIFENFGDMEAAKAYYYEGLLCLKQDTNADRTTSHYALLMANLVHLSCYFNEVDKAEEYLKEFENIDLNKEDNVWQYYISLCHIAVAQNDLEKFYTLSDKIIMLSKSESEWGYQFFELLMHIAKYSLEFKNKQYSHEVLLVLNAISCEDEIGNHARIQEYWVQYYEMFGTDRQRGWAYKHYYELKQIIDITNNKAMAAGLHAKIDLHEAAKKQAQMIQENAQLAREAQRDQLTQLYNRRYFTRIIDDMYADFEIQSLGLVMIDVDYFKQYNDTYGHGSGDDTLRAVAQSMTLASCHNKDIYDFRYGGDEFICIYANCDNSDMTAFLETLLKEIANRKIPHESSPCCKTVSLSVGYSIGTRNANGHLNADELLEQADQALYKAKELGRNQYCMYKTSWISS